MLVKHSTVASCSTSAEGELMCGVLRVIGLFSLCLGAMVATLGILRQHPSTLAWLVFDSNSDGGANTDIYRMRLDGSDMTNLTRHPDTDINPIWSPDGQ